MKKMKRIVVACCAILLLVGSTIVVQAEGERRAPACPNCPSGRITKTVKDYGWKPTGTYRNCIHYSKGQDEYMVKRIKTTYSCGSCGFSSSDVETLYKWDCKGHN